MKIVNTVVINGKRHFGIEGIKGLVDRDDIIGNPKVGQHVILEEGKYIVSSHIDPNCVNGVCSLPLPDNR